MDIIFGLLALVALIAFFAGLFMLIVKKWRKKGWKILLISFVVLLGAVAYSNQIDKKKSQELGFATVTDYQDAKAQKITDPKQWEIYKAKQAAEAEKKAKEQVEAEAMQAEKAEQERKEQALKEEKERQEATQKEQQQRQEASNKEARKAIETPQQQVKNTPAQEEVVKVKPKFDPSKNIKLIINQLNAQNITWQSNWHTICTTETFCSVNVGNFRVETMGAIAEIKPRTGDVNTANYMELCSTLLSALGGINQGQADSYIIQAFKEGSKSGNAKYKINSVDLTVHKGSDSYLKCSFVRLTDSEMLSPTAKDEAQGNPEAEIEMPDDGESVPMRDLDWSDLDQK